MISCTLKGGLGNLMFQIAFLEYSGNMNKYQTGYWNLDQHLQHLNKEVRHNSKLQHADEYLTMFKNFKWPRINAEAKGRVNTWEWALATIGTLSGKAIASVVHIPFHFENFVTEDNVVYNGFFQSEKYFPNREFILDLFQPSDFVNSQLEKYNHIFKETTCSIHVRRGDYLKFSHIHKSEDFTYYQKGMSLVSEVDKYLIFSDDIEWCKEKFVGDQFIFIENEKDYIEIFLQSKCDHNIISSSTFSWWGAYLNNKPNRKSIGPAQWFSNNKKNDVMPESWQSI